MGRYSRAVYGTGKYGLDLWTEQSVEPMDASIEVDNVFSHSSSFTNDWGDCVYDRVQVSWLQPQGVDRSVLLRSNLGFPTGPSDPFASTLLDSNKAQRTNYATDPGFERGVGNMVTTRSTVSSVSGPLLGALRTNLAPGGGTMDSLTGWSGSTPTFSIDSGALKVTPNTGGSYIGLGAKTDALPASAGQVVTVAYDVKSATPDPWNEGVVFYYLDASGADLGSAVSLRSTFSPGTGYTRRVFTHTVPADAVKVWIMLAASGTPYVAGQAWWVDNVTVEIGPRASDGSWFTSPVPYSTRRNLCTNPGFEVPSGATVGTPNWTPGGGQAGTARSSEWSASGSWSMKLAPYSGSGSSYLWWSPVGTRSIPVTPGTTSLTVGFTVNQLGADTPGGSVRVACYDASGTDLGSTFQSPVGTVVSGVRRYVVTVSGLPSGTAFVRPGILEGFKTEGAYVDQVTFEEGVTDGSYFDGNTPPTNGFSYRWEGTADASVSAQFAAVAPYSGTKSLEVTTTANGGSYLSVGGTTDMPVSPGQLVDVSVAHLPDEGVTSAATSAYFYDASGKFLNVLSRTQSVVPKTWNLVTDQFIAPAGAAFSRAVVGSGTNRRVGAVEYFDDLLVTTRERLTDFSFSQKGNLAYNGGSFEDGVVPAQWSCTRGPLTVDSSYTTQGSYSMMATATTDGALYVHNYRAECPVQEGQFAVVSADVMCSKAWNPVLTVLFYSASGSLLQQMAVTNSSGVVAPATVEAKTWTRQKAGVRAPKGAASFRVQIAQHNTGAVGDSIWVDAIDMRVIDCPPVGESFDGSTPGYSNLDGHFMYAWNGAQGVSTSTETVTGSVTAGTSAVTPWRTDPFDRPRVAYLDRNVEPGREYFYAVWTYVASAQEWILSGRAMVTTSSDHGLVEAFRSALPAYIWNAHGGPGDGVDVLPDPDQENHMGRFLQSFSWQLDKTLTKVDLLRSVWDPQRTPAVVLDEAVSMYGLPNEPALGARASRALLANAAEITGERGSLAATGLLVESLTGFATDLQVGTNLICSTDESSFEGMSVVSESDPTVVNGTGRWYFTNARKTRVGGDPSPAPGGGVVQIARTPNSDEVKSAGTTSSRYGIRLDPVDATKYTSMTLGERIKVSKVTSLGGSLSQVSTAWVHGLEVGDKVSMSIDGGATSAQMTVLAVLGDFDVRVEAPAKFQGVSTAPADGYLFGGMIPVYQGVPVKELKQYSLVGKFQGATGATNFSLKVTYWDRYGNQLGTITAAPSTGLAAMPAWSTAYNSGSSPAGAVSATATIILGQTGSPQFLGVDSLMLKPGGTPFNASLPYETVTAFDGSVDYTYEDARLLTVTIDPSKTPSNGPIPVSIAADHRAVVESRLTAILAAYLPAGTAFVIRWASGS